MHEQWKQVKKVLDDLVMNWDPLELSNTNSSMEWDLRKEYETYTTTLASMITKGCAKEELELYLYNVEAHQMGIIPSEDNIERYIDIVMEKLKILQGK